MMRGTMRLVVLLGLIASSVCWFEQPRDDEDEWMSGVYEAMQVQQTDDSSPASPQPILGSRDDDLIVDFMLYTRDNLHNYTLIRPEMDGSLEAMDLTKDLKMIIHGWRNGYDSPFGEIMKEAYLAEMDVNVMVLDWSSRSYKNYVGSRMSVAKVAQQVAALLDKLAGRGQSLDKVHLIGHSLGAHIAGIAGLRMRSGQVARVTGLDPAAPMFTATEADLLQPASARFVDVIHTCGYLLGFISPLGHADFYPNKGTPPQPGCGFDYTGECSHSRAYELFADSISSKAMMAVQCEDQTAYDESRCYRSPPVPMGHHTPPTANGLFFLKTRRSAPYGMGNPIRKTL